jgi:hydrogenase maturation protease
MTDTGSTAPAPVRIVGIGSASGSDALGWYAADRLLASGWAGRYPAGMLEVSTCPTPAQLPAMLNGTRLLLLIDALLDGGTPGRLQQLTADQLAAGSQASSHGVGVAEALALIEALQGDAIQVVVLGVSVGTAGHGTNSDSLLDTAWPSLQTALDEIIGQYLAQGVTAGLPPAGAGRYW